MSRQLSPALDRVYKGLVLGLSTYFQSQTRVALVWQASRTSPRLICDPMKVLWDHRDAVNTYYSTLTPDDFVEIPPPGPNSFSRDFEIRVDEAPTNVGNLLTVAARSSHILYQRWFVELPVNVCHDGPIYPWVRRAIVEGSADVFYEGRVFNLGTQAWLSAYAEAAVHWYLLRVQDRKRPKSNATVQEVIDYYLPLQSILKSVSTISTAVEEGKSATGTIAFLPNDEISELLKDPEYKKISPALVGTDNRKATLSLKNTKLARKLLSITDQSICLISNGSTFNAIGPIPPVGRELFLAKFHLGRASIEYNGALICCLSNGQVFGLKPQADLSEVRSVLLKKSDAEIEIETIMFAIQSIVDQARYHRHGCTIVVDISNSERAFSGQKLTPPIKAIEKNLPLFQRMSGVDGAISLNKKGELTRFAVLLDGMISESEDPARGARYNSVVRFMNNNEADYIIVVASEDGPVAVFFQDCKVPVNREPQEVFELEPVEYTEWEERVSSVRT